MSTEQQPSDAELISAVRGGDTTAYGELFSRHVEAARRLARQLTSAGDVEDLVSEAFAKVLTIVQRGGGPDLAFRAYLLTAVRSLHIDSVRGAARLKPVDDFTPFDSGVPFRDTAVEGFENQAAARAFATLPERWQLVLWHTEVEGQKPADVAQLLGMSANSVSALAYRAREGLRQAFLNMHAQDADDDACAWTQDNLGAYIRNASSRRDSVKVRAHIDECRRCMGIYLELSEVNSNLSGVLGPLVLGSAAAGYIAAAVGGAAAQGGGLLGFFSAHATASALTGVAAAIVVIMGLFIGLRGPADQGPAVADPRLNTPPAQVNIPVGGPTGGPIIDLSQPPASNGGPSASPDAPFTPVAPSDAEPSNPPPSSNPSSPDEETEATLDPPTPTPTVKDVTILATRKVDADGDLTRVRVSMAGLEEGGGELFINSPPSTEGLTIGMDGRCHVVNVNDYLCAIGANPDPLNFSVNAAPGTGVGMFVFELTPDTSVEDADPFNNGDEVTVQPAPAQPVG